MPSIVTLSNSFGDEDVKQIMFKDNKDFTLEVAKNRQNEVYMGWSIPFTETTLKAKIKECWRQIGIGKVRKSIATWRKRVRADVELERGSTDHLKN
ncbi:hypothetical protein ElyMa_004705100 [Elysia marginata]|uniref:Uncharacterized protein n=1 Tax=Elysia marginata TaxID=1093978 RepID=A0AAV4I7G7_9GAST|nr:hypothetical protein ElyMa_004705100 [Elysia marginata]